MKTYILQDIVYILAVLHKADTHTSVRVAELCDNHLDRSGALLGKVREIGYEEGIEKVPILPRADIIKAFPIKE
jgi:hypothetical protein